MHVAVAFALLLQQPAAPASFSVAKVEITPSVAEVEVGQRVQLSARAFDASGQPVRNATIEWFVASDVGSVDSTGLVSGGYRRVARVAAVARLPGQQGQKIEFALVRVVPEAAARIDVAPAPGRVMAGTRPPPTRARHSKQRDPRPPPLSLRPGHPPRPAATPRRRPRQPAAGRRALSADAR